MNTRWGPFPRTALKQFQRGFRPRRPATNAPRHLITVEEAKLDVAALLTMSLESITEVEVASGVAKPVAWFREKT